MTPENLVEQVCAEHMDEALVVDTDAALLDLATRALKAIPSTAAVASAPIGEQVARDFAKECDNDAAHILMHGAEGARERELIGRRLTAAARMIERLANVAHSSTRGSEEVLAKIQKALVHVHDLCAGREKWTMRVPARPDMDSDLIIADALESAAKALMQSPSANERIVEAAKRWRAACTAWDTADVGEGHGGSPLEGREEELRGAEVDLARAVDALTSTGVK